MVTTLTWPISFSGTSGLQTANLSCIQSIIVSDFVLSFISLVVLVNMVEIIILLPSPFNFFFSSVSSRPSFPLTPQHLLLNYCHRIARGQLWMCLFIISSNQLWKEEWMISISCLSDLWLEALNAHIWMWVQEMASLVGDAQMSHMVWSAITWSQRQQWSNWEGEGVWAWLDKAAKATPSFTLMKLLSEGLGWRREGMGLVVDVICHTIWIFRRAGERPPPHMSSYFASESCRRGELGGKEGCR